MSDITNPDRRCLGYHGSAAWTDYSLYGCGENPVDGGVLLVKFNATTKTFSSRKIAYPSDGDRTSTVETHSSNPYFLGNYGRSSTGYKSLIAIHHQAASLSISNVISFDSIVCAFGFERKLGFVYYVQLADGTVRIMNSTTHIQIQSIQLPGNASCGTGVASPAKVAVGDMTLAVAVPATNGSSGYDVYIYSLVDFTFRTNSVAGVVRGMTIFGLYEHFDDFPAQQCNLSPIAPAPVALGSAPTSQVGPAAVTAPTGSAPSGQIRSPASGAASVGPALMISLAVIATIVFL